MSVDTDNPGVLYYPFSRCIDMSSLKQMLLLFESIAFCDPVNDEDWRTHSFRQIEREDPNFRIYREMSEAIPQLLESGVIRTINPSKVGAIQDEITTDAILADVNDLINPLIFDRLEIV